MRQECQAVIVDNEHGRHVFYAPFSTEVIAGFPDLASMSNQCGKPAVDALDGFIVNINGEEPATKEIKIPLCAEHWDMFQKGQL